jgi:hypothetical protein
MGMETVMEGNGASSRSCTTPFHVFKVHTIKVTVSMMETKIRIGYYWIITGFTLT